MKKLRQSIIKLSSFTNEDEIENALQKISELILRNYHMEFGNAKVYFTDIEMYYINKGVYDDATVHCDVKQTHFNEVYVHRHRKNHCFDICISLGDYYLSFLVRGAIVNDIPYYLPSKVYDAIFKRGRLPACGDSTQSKSIEINFDEAKDILIPNLREIDDKYVMFSTRYNLSDKEWKRKKLRAVIDTTLIGKKIPKKEELLKSLTIGLNGEDAANLSKSIIGYIPKDL